jgi:hypothetical protein
VKRIYLIAAIVLVVTVLSRLIIERKRRSELCRYQNYLSQMSIHLDELHTVLASTNDQVAIQEADNWIRKLIATHVNESGPLESTRAVGATLNCAKRSPWKRDRIEGNR